MKINKKRKKEITDIEKILLKHASLGAQNSKIANAMYLSVDTVKAHMSEIYKKLNAENRTHAVYIAMKDHIIH